MWNIGVHSVLEVRYVMKLKTSSLMPASLKTWHSDLKFCQSLIFLDFLGVGACERRVVMVIMTTCAKDRPDIGPHRGASRTQGNFGWLPPRGVCSGWYNYDIDQPNLVVVTTYRWHFIEESRLGLTRNRNDASPKALKADGACSSVYWSGNQGEIG